MDIAIVIGGSAGIGQATAIELARRGYGVVLTYRSHPEGGEETARMIEQAGGQAVALKLDAADYGVVPRLRREKSAASSSSGGERVTSRHWSTTPARVRPPCSGTSPTSSTRVCTRCC